MYISITGLKLLKPWKVFRFYWYAIPCLNTAKNTPGNILLTFRTTGLFF